MRALIQFDRSICEIFPRRRWRVVTSARQFSEFDRRVDAQRLNVVACVHDLLTDNKRAYVRVRAGVFSRHNGTGRTRFVLIEDTTTSPSNDYVCKRCRPEHTHTARGRTSLGGGVFLVCTLRCCDYCRDCAAQLLIIPAGPTWLGPSTFYGQLYSTLTHISASLMSQSGSLSLIRSFAQAQKRREVGKITVQHSSGPPAASQICRRHTQRFRFFYDAAATPTVLYVQPMFTTDAGRVCGMHYHAI